MSDNFIPQLTLEPDAPENPPADPRADITPVKLDESSLSEAERKAVADFAEKIDITDSGLILQYGSAAQKKLSDFSQSALERVKTKDLGSVGEMISGLVTELRGFSVEQEEKGIAAWFKRGGNRIAALKTRYDKAEVNVSRISGMLEDHQIQLLKDIEILDQMYERNLVNFKEIGMYILAGKRRLEQVRSEVLPKLIETAQKTGLPEDSQRANDLGSCCDRFEKKLHDLELTRMISLQMAPQIRLVQNNDTLMAEKIQSTLTNTIPLWKSQMVLALGVQHSAEAMRAQREVTDMTNELLKKNAETLKMATVETARESERGIVDIETLQTTNRMLIETLDEVMKIQTDGRVKRREAEAELGRIEGELKQKLIEIKQ